MYINPYEFKIDIGKIKTYAASKSLNFIEGDYNTCVLDFYLNLKGEKIDLSLFDFKIALKSNTISYEQACTIDEVLNNNVLSKVIRCILKNEIIADSNTYDGALLMYDKDSVESRRTIANFKLSIKDQVLSPDTIEASDQFDTLTQIIEDAKKVVKVVDAELSTTSKNAIQNSTVTLELNKKLDKTGGTITGDLSQENGNFYTKGIFYGANITTGNQEVIETWDTIINLGNNLTTLRLHSLDEVQIDINNALYSIYHTGNKPNLSELPGTAKKSETANKLSNTITISLTGDINGSSSFDGSENISINTKVKGISTDSELSSTSTNPVQNKVIKEALDNKLDNTGTAAKADKLSAAREIELIGDIAGSGSFDGSENISIETHKRCCSVGQINDQISETWFKFADININQVYCDREITFKVSTSSSSYDHKCGILRAHIRVNDDSNGNLVVGRARLNWEYASDYITFSNFVIAYYTDSSTNTVFASLWVKCDLPWTTYHFDVLHEHDREGSIYHWNLYKTTKDNTMGYTEIPSNYTQVNSSSLDLVNNISGTAANAKKLSTARNISLTGAIVGNGSFDGSGDLSIPATLNIEKTSAALGAPWSGTIYFAKIGSIKIIYMSEIKALDTSTSTATICNIPSGFSPSNTVEVIGYSQSHTNSNTIIYIQPYGIIEIKGMSSNSLLVFNAVYI